LALYDRRIEQLRLQGKDLLLNTINGSKFSRRAKLSDVKVLFPSLAGSTEKSAKSDCRIPAVIGTKPFSWRGDDNTGNMIHAAAARRMISKFVEYEGPGEWSDADIERLRSEHSHLVFVTANLIRLGVPGDHPSIKQLTAGLVPLAKNIERAGLPVVVFGLGTQASLNGPYQFTAAAETVRLLKVISDHARKIAVRGPFTAEACHKLGIKNVEVIGCQSMFWHRSPHFSWKLSETVPEKPDSVVFNFTDAPSEADLINQAIARGHDVIGQQNDAEEDLRANENGPQLVSPTKYNWGVAFAFEKGLMKRADYEQWIKRHFYQFRRPEPWLEHVRQYSFSYGTRLHGNIAAMLAGVRAMWIVHDMRLKEVCERFRLPTIEFEEVRAGVDLQALYERADYSECCQIYPKRYRALFDYVDGAGLPHSLPTPIDSPVSRVTDVVGISGAGPCLDGGSFRMPAPQVA
jgi:hypothetical protein